MTIKSYFRKPPTEQTERLILRKMKITDLSDVYEYAHDPSTSQYLLWNPHQSRLQTFRYLCRIERMIRKKKYYDFAIVDKQSGKMIGTCGFTALGEDGTAEVGYVLAPKYWGRGYAAEALSRVLELAFERFGLEAVRAEYYTENAKSRRVAEKCGMTPAAAFGERLTADGITVKTEIAIITREEYRKINHK